MMSERLNSKTSSELPSHIVRSSYDRNLVPSVIHIGPGAFHRAHQAAYFDELMSLGDTGWMIECIALRSNKAISALKPQNGLYTLREHDGLDHKDRLIKSVGKVTDGGANPEAAIVAIARPHTKLVTLTITEKGYDDIGFGSAAHLIACGLRRRKLKYLPGITIISCDNLSNNGEIARTAVLKAADQIDRRLADWIEANNAFPSSMVDRITPATTNADKDNFRLETGLRDEGLTLTESFTQWVIEDNFVGDKPGLAALGVQLTNDVEAWEKAKLRLLNGAHSALAYLGGLCGYTFIHEAINDHTLFNFVDKLWDEVETTLPEIPGFNAKTYRSELIARFKNSSLNHKTEQIAVDGSRKIPQRLIPPLIERQSKNQTSPAICLALMAWVRWQNGTKDDGRTFLVEDPNSDLLASTYSKGDGDPRKIVESFMEMDDLFPKVVSEDKSVRELMSDLLQSLVDEGVTTTVSEAFKQLQTP